MFRCNLGLLKTRNTQKAKIMKKTLFAALAASALMIALAAPSFGAEKETKERTITGEGKCAKCSLKETKECQNVIQVEKNGKTRTYYLVDNDVSKAFHKNVCQEAKKVTATGTVEKKDGKFEWTATKIDVAK